MRADASYSKTFSKMMWIMALLLVVFTAGCDRDHGAAAPGTGAIPTVGATAAASPNAPAVTTVTPADIASGTCINQIISATFSEPMSAPTITAAGTFTVKETFGSTVTGTVTYDAITMVATLTTSTLISGTNYTATITTAATDAAGTALEADKVWSFTAGSTICAPSVNMGLAAPFGIAATAGVTNTLTAPITHINGDVVLDPLDQCNAVVVDNAGGFGLCAGAPPTINGQVITNTFPDAGLTSGAVKADLNATFLSITPSAGPPAAGSLDGGTPLAAPTTLGAPTGNALVEGDNLFYPGVYISITSILITDDLTLDAQGDPNARFVFQSASSLDTADGAPSPGAHGRILLINGAKASNVWWQVASSATLGLYTEFNGNILAAIDITMKTGATSCGRLMAGAWVGVPGGLGAFVFDSNVVSVPGNVNAPASCK